MKILSLATDSAGRTLLTTTRAPDLWRRDIAARTGEAHLRFVAVTPAGTSIDDLLVRLDVWLASIGAEPAILARFANTPTRIFAVDAERIHRWLRLEIERAARPSSHPLRALARLRSGVSRPCPR